jgi:hypothetical protein
MIAKAEEIAGAQMAIRSIAKCAAAARSKLGQTAEAFCLQRVGRQFELLEASQEAREMMTLL